MSANNTPGPTMDQFISALPSTRDAVLRSERRRVFACKYIETGALVQTGCGPAVATGIVVSVTPRRFEVQFPPQVGGPDRPWTRCFRREDGRSVGGRVYTWATPVSAIAKAVQPAQGVGE